MYLCIFKMLHKCITNITLFFNMQNTDREFFKELRKNLPGTYAMSLFRHYQRQKVKISRSLIIKVAHGERRNVKILGDLMTMAEEHEKIEKRMKKFEKRLNSRQSVVIRV